MSFISLHFLAVILCLFSLYYILPKKSQPYLLLLGNIYFYFRNSGNTLFYSLLLLWPAMDSVSYLQKKRGKDKKPFSFLLSSLCSFLSLH